MCGIVGLFGGDADPESVRSALLRLQHRGPDDSGCWRDEAANLQLGHTRLAIVGVDASGHQPMHSRNGRFVIAFNGEIYNYRELRNQLVGVDWHGTSDTEVLVEAIARWGIAESLARATGMFALALWDREQRILYLARDRFGEKPLYYGRLGKALAFASELNAFRELPGFSLDIDRDALAAYMQTGVIPGSSSIQRGMSKVRPGTFVQFTGANSEGVVHVFWSAATVAGTGTAYPKKYTSERQAVDEAEAVLGEVVASRMLADVPLGAFLSGGIDSSLVTAMMKARGSGPVRTFSIGFDDARYNEADHAERVARALGTEHTEFRLTPESILDVVPSLASIYDEPFADSSQLPTHMVARLARPHITVALTGDGGDELFAGYNRYAFAQRYWPWLERVPVTARGVLASALRLVSQSSWDRILGSARVRLIGEKVHKAARALESVDDRLLYENLVGQPDMDGIVLNDTPSVEAYEWPALPSIAERMMLSDTIRYLPDDILVKVDRASMAVSLETRAPFLDHRLFEFAWHLPLELKLRSGQGKWILRQVLYRHISRDIVSRPKMGFAIPLGDWLRGPLRAWAAGYLDESRIRGEGYLDAAKVTGLWVDHLTGKRDAQHQLWNILMFQAWLERHGATG